MSAKKKLDTDLVASELTESAYFQPTKPQVDKPTKPEVEKYTTHLRPETIKAIKVYVDLKDYEVAQLALDRFLQESGVTGG